ncbi:PRTRC system protein E [Caenimonas sedimenti]|uniref:PRTRC system protein E n=1 Tax=Caenimonas sedimenti TaxID=2596921 RepID=A0A562ZSJ0_9BURK|nr:PRTRC system protein E [Caenimonas sedimenti]TWO71493.1 PRTRC system protein E [Caenimonas sedimenti]
MKLVQTLEPLLKQGVVLTLRFRAADDKVRVEILPEGKENKAGIQLLPKSACDTAAELDAGLEGYFDKYVASQCRTVSLADSTDAELAAAEKDAQDKARKALDDKRAAKSPAKAGKSSGKPKRDITAGVSGSDDDNDNEDDEDDDHGSTGNEGDEDAGTTLKPSGAAPGPAPAQAGGGEGAPSDGLSSALF